MDPELKFKILTVGYGLFSLVLLTGFTYSLFLFYKYLKAGSWPRAEGQVLKSKIVVDNSGDGVSYRPDIVYSYCVDGIKYTSETIYAFSLWQTKRSAAFLTNRYKANDIVKVAFNPHSPQESTLITGMSRLHFNAASVLIFMFVVGGYFLIGFVQGIKNWI